MIPRAGHYITLARDYYNNGDFDHVTYTVGYGLHYVQDALSPLHAGGNSGKLHQEYEGAGTKDWQDYYNIDCSNFDVCPGHNAVLNSGNINQIDSLIKSNSYANKTGNALLSDSVVKNYVGNTRWVIGRRQLLMLLKKVFYCGIWLMQ
ncbi:MAG: hypothetical protein FWH29_10890 [Methanobrevibacter sp.]|nr:hypothetical protein [Methanobrevibacter sp.]